MVKYCIKQYPMGSFKGQASPGKYMDGYLHNNLKNMAKKITQDMTYMAIIFSSTLEVGTGKSVLATQIGEAWTELIKQEHGIEVPWNVDNVVWRPKDLIEKSFKLPKYSCILLDEWEDSGYWSELGMSLRQFFRKCRQLNLFIICIIPNWFQMPLNYAVSRSIFAIDVRFNDNLDRGYFGFYNFPAKRMLYILGKRNHNYKVCRQTFQGRFTDGYGVDEVEYRKRKYEDMLKYDDEDRKQTKAEIEAAKGVKHLAGYLKMHPKATLKECSQVFGVSEVTISMWKRGVIANLTPNPINFTKNLSIREIVVDEKGLMKEEAERENNLVDDPYTNEEEQDEQKK